MFLLMTRAVAPGGIRADPLWYKSDLNGNNKIDDSRRSSPLLATELDLVINTARWGNPSDTRLHGATLYWRSRLPADIHKARSKVRFPARGGRSTLSGNPTSAIDLPDSRCRLCRDARRPGFAARRRAYVGLPILPYPLLACGARLPCGVVDADHIQFKH